jgi:hypothetical protein
MKAVVKLRPTSPYNEELLGVIAAAQGKFEEAIKYQKKALQEKHYADRQGAKAHARLSAYAAQKPYRE